MTTRHAACSCGQLNLTIEGEPSRISMCHCLECQRRTGAVISNQARFHREQVTFTGQATAWKRSAESGNSLTFHFCPTCGSTVYWEGEGFPGYVAVAIGNFADPNFPAPAIAVWEESRGGCDLRDAGLIAGRHNSGDRAPLLVERKLLGEGNLPGEIFGPIQSQDERDSSPLRVKSAQGWRVLQ